MGYFNQKNNDIYSSIYYLKLCYLYQKINANINININK